MIEANDMISKTFSLSTRIVLSVLVVLSLALLSDGQESTKQTNATGVQKSFSNPDEAAKAVIQAASDYDVTALLQIFGPQGEDFIASADPVRDKSNGVAFAERARRKTQVVIDPKNSSRATIVVGDNAWPFPVPLVKKNGAWRFDSAAGKQEILFRRIGANELDAIQVCRGFVEAQHEYALQIHDDSGINQYAQKIMSSPGKQDGLYWVNADGSHGGPISVPVARAIEEGYSTDKHSAYHGYYFKVLKGQGPAAPMGRLDYVIEGVMIGGFALIAVPAEYGVTGIKTFIVSNDGIVYQNDLGADSLEIAKKTELYNPDKSWQRTDDQWPADAWEVAAADTRP
jgi:hypothetical protein